jgi:hypothetical protein
MKFHHRAVPIVLVALLIDAILAFTALLLVWFGVVRRLHRVAVPA